MIAIIGVNVKKLHSKRWMLFNEKYSIDLGIRNFVVEANIQNE
jgi:hypothetical protein